MWFMRFTSAERSVPGETFCRCGGDAKTRRLEERVEKLRAKRGCKNEVITVFLAEPAIAQVVDADNAEETAEKIAFYYM